MSKIPDHLDIEVDDPELVRASRPVVPGRATVRVPRVRARATVRPETRATDVLTTTWDWAALRDYVMRMAEETHGQLLRRDPLVEKGTFSGFIRRFGAVDAQRIARYAFEGAPRPGFWLGAPIRPGRFAKAADEVFADVILEQLNQR